MQDFKTNVLNRRNADAKLSDLMVMYFDNGQRKIGAGYSKGLSVLPQ